MINAVRIPHKTQAICGLSQDIWKPLSPRLTFLIVFFGQSVSQTVSQAGSQLVIRLVARGRVWLDAPFHTSSDHEFGNWSAVLLLITVQITRLVAVTPEVWGLGLTALGLRLGLRLRV